MTKGAGPGFVPRVPSSVVTRDRLLDRLDASRGTPLIVLRAPAGGGKTSLLVDWLAHSPRPVAWVTVGCADVRRLAFWERAVAALVRSGALPDDSKLGNLTISNDISGSLRSRLLDAFTGLPSRVLLVVDDFQHVDDPQVADDLIWLLSSGASMDVVVASRTSTPFELSTLRARVDTLVLGPEDLAFALDETLAVARDAGVSDDDARIVHEAFGGLPLAVRAAVLELASHRDWSPTRALESVGQNQAAHLLSDDIDVSYRDFLLRLSVAETANGELIESFVGPDAGDHLERAEHDGVGAWTDGPDGPRFALQPYLRAQLLAELARRLPEEATRLQVVYGQSLAAAGDAMGALRQLSAAGDWDAVTRVVLSGYSDLVRLHDVEVGEVLASAGSTVLRRHPLLLVFRLFVDNRRRTLPRTTRLHKANLAVALIQARLGVGDPRDRAPLLVALLGMQRLGGHYDSALDTAERLVSLIATYEDNGREELLGLLPTTFVHAATTFLYGEMLDRADELFRVAVELAEREDRPWPELHASSMRLLLQAIRGLPGPLELAAARERVRPADWRGTYPAAGYHLAEAYTALEHFNGTEARAHLDQLAAHEHTIEHWPLIARLRGLAALVEGRPYLGLERLTADIAAHDDRPSTSRFMSTMLAATRAELLLAEGEPHRAEVALRSARRAPAAALTRARIHLVLGHHEQVIAEVAEFAWSVASYPRPKAEALLLTAAAAAGLGRDADARLAAGRGLDLLAEAGLRRPLMMVRRSDLSAALSLAGHDPAVLLDGVPDVFPSGDSTATLTLSELRVLEELRVSSSTEDIATALFLSINTVKSHQRTIYRKLGVRSREAALAVAALRGIIPDQTDPPHQQS